MYLPKCSKICSIICFIQSVTKDMNIFVIYHPNKYFIIWDIKYKNYVQESCTNMYTLQSNAYQIYQTLFNDSILTCILRCLNQKGKNK